MSHCVLLQYHSSIYICDTKDSEEKWWTIYMYKKPVTAPEIFTSRRSLFTYNENNLLLLPVPLRWEVLANTLKMTNVINHSQSSYNSIYLLLCTPEKDYFSWLHLACVHSPSPTYALIHKKSLSTWDGHVWLTRCGFKKPASNWSSNLIPLTFRVLPFTKLHFWRVLTENGLFWSVRSTASEKLTYTLHNHWKGFIKIADTK